MKRYFIGALLDGTDDVFEKARIRLTYNLSVFLFLVSMLFGATLIFKPIPWQIMNFVANELFLASIFFVLRYTSRVKYAGYIFLFVQIYLMTLNAVMNKFEMRLDGAFWAVMGVVYTFSVLGNRWGLGVTLYIVIQIIVSVLYQEKGNNFLDAYIDPEDIPPHHPFMTFMPLSIIAYSIWQINATRKEAEKQIREQKAELEIGKSAMELRNKEVTDSINYAKRIQLAVLPSFETIARSIPLSFIYYVPKDIVSGDFYWFHEIDKDRSVLVCADCTGHGVPGALMTVIGSNLLHRVVVEDKIVEPSRILAASTIVCCIL